MKVYDGAAMIADKSDATIVPVASKVSSAHSSRVSRPGMVRRSLFPKVSVTFLEPRKLEIDPALVGRKRRIAAGAALYDVSPTS